MTPKLKLKNRYADDSISSSIIRGSAEATARGINFLNWVDDNTGNHFISDEFMKKNQKILDDLEQTKEFYSTAGLSQDRLNELDNLKKQSANAKGFVEDTKAGLNSLVDTAMHPTEWTIQGAVANILPTDPANALSLVTGGVGGKIVGKTLNTLGKKTAFSVADGVVSNSLAEYGVARGGGKSEDEAIKIATQAGIAGAVIPAAYAATGATLSKATNKIDNTNSTINTTQNLQEVTSVNNDIEKSPYIVNTNELKEVNSQELQASLTQSLQQDSKIIQDVELESNTIHKQTNDTIIKAIDQGASIDDIVSIKNNIPVSKASKDITKIINDGKQTTPRLSGTKIINVIQDSINNPTKSLQEIDTILQNENVSDSLRDVAIQSIKVKDTAPIEDFISAKLSDTLEIKQTGLKNSILQNTQIENQQKYIDELNYKNSLSKKKIKTFIDDTVPKNLQDENYKAMIYELNKIGLVDDLKIEDIKTKYNQPYADGAYQNKKIYLDKNTQDNIKMETITHEFVHSATEKLLNDKLFKNDMQLLLDGAREDLSDIENHPALENVKEFVAYGLSDPDIAKRLNDIKLSKELKQKLNLDESYNTIWDIIVDRFNKAVSNITGKTFKIKKDGYFKAMNNLVSKQMRDIKRLEKKQKKNNIKSKKKNKDVDIDYRDLTDEKMMKDIGVVSSKTRADRVLNKLKNELNRKNLSVEETDILDVYLGDKTKAEIKTNDLNDVIKFVHGGRKKGAKKIIVKHGEVDTTGGLTTLELVKIGEVIRNGKINNNSYSQTNNSIRYGYDYKKGGVKFRVVVEEFNDGKKIFDYYSDRNFIEVDKTKHPLNSTSNTKIIPQSPLFSKSKQQKHFKLWRKYEKTIDKVVDYGYDKLLMIPELLSHIPKEILAGINKKQSKNIKNTRWFTVTQLHKDTNKSLNQYNINKAVMYEDINEQIEKPLEKLSKQNSKDLVKALNGDMKPDKLNTELKKIYKNFRDTIDQNADKLINLGVLDKKDKIENYIKRYYEEHLEMVDASSGINLGKLKKRKDIDYDKRVEIGMIEDASFVIANTIAEQNTLIEKATLLKKLDEQFSAKKDNIPDNYVQIPSYESKKGLKSFGALGGKYVPQELKTALDESRIIEQEKLDLQNMLYAMTDHLKVNLTVKNPVTHLYNIGSNLLLSFLNKDLTEVSKLLYMRVYNPTEFKALVKEANQYGLNSQLDDMEKPQISLRKLSDNFMDKDAEYFDKNKGAYKSAKELSVNVIQTIFKELYLSAESKTGKTARDLYDWEDKIFKLAAYKKNKAKGLDNETAFKEANDVYVDYTTPLPAGIRFLDKSGLMPFLHYQYKATPATLKVMLKNPLRTLLLGSGIATLGALRWQDEDDRYLKPHWAKDKLINMFGAKEWTRVGNGYYFNSGRLIPGTKLDFEIGGFIKSGLLILDGKTPLGYSISKKYDDTMTRYANTTLVAMENFLPPVTFGRYGQRFTKIGLGEANIIEPPQNRITKQPDTVKDTALRALGVREFNEDKELRSKETIARRLKKHNDKNPNTNKQQNKKEYEKTIQDIKKVREKYKPKLPLNKDKKDKFDFKIGDKDFDF